MAITYREKRRLVRQISNPKAWQNDFDHARELMLSRCFHAVAIDPAIWSGPRSTLLEISKLLVARDFAIEPTLKAFNGISAKAIQDQKAKIEHERMVFDDAYALNNNQITTLDAFEKPWDDMVEFEGTVDTPRYFLAEDHRDRLMLRMELAAREQIWAQGHVFNQAMHGAPARGDLPQAEIEPTTILHVLNEGSFATDHRGNTWLYAVITSAEIGIINQQARDILQRRLGLRGDEALAIRFKEDRLLIAMKADTLHKLNCAVDASNSLRHEIIQGAMKSEKAIALLEAGADMKFIDPIARERGQTFASMARQYDRYELLSAFRDWKGVHDLSAEASRPVRDYCEPPTKREFG